MLDFTRRQNTAENDAFRFFRFIFLKFRLLLFLFFLVFLILGYYPYHTGDFLIFMGLMF